MKRCKTKLLDKIGGLPDDVLCTVLYSAVWMIMYYTPAQLGMGLYSPVHACIEGACAAILIVLLLRDGRADPSPAEPPRLAWYAAPLLIGLSALLFAAYRIVCLSGDQHAGYSAPTEMLGTYCRLYVRPFVTAPLMEEIGCRWILFGRLRRHCGFGLAAAASTIAFAAIHIGIDWRLVISVIPGAILSCLIYECTGKLRYCVAEHMIHNLLCSNIALWHSTVLWERLYGVPLSIGIPVLAAATALVVAVCACRDKLFVRKA